MKTDELALFLDTNSLLHYPPIKDVDWRAVAGCSSVRLILCMQVIHELDEKKDDPRLGDRASRTIKDSKAIRKSGGAVRDGVTLEVFNYEIRAADFPVTLSYDSKDDRIVHSVKKYSEENPDARVAVYTEDMGMSLRCEGHGISVVEPDTKKRLENPQDELTKKYRQSVSELNALKNRLPAFTVRVVPAGTTDFQTENKYELYDSWQPVDPAAEVEKIKQAYEKPAQPSAGRLPLAAIAFGGHISEDEWKRYRQELENYYVTYGVYCQQLNTWGATKDRTIDFDIWLNNTGSSPAEDVDFILKLPPRLAWVTRAGTDAAKPLSRPEPPQPPKKPTPRLFDSLDYLTRMREITPVTAHLERMLVEREKEKVEVHRLADDGFLIHAKLKRLKHGQASHLGTFSGVFVNWSEIGPFHTEYTISTSEIPEKVTGKVPFVVRSKGTSHE